MSGTTDIKLILHIGAHKTATTHLQHRLGAASGKLRALGTGYFGPRDTREGIDLTALMAQPGRWPAAEDAWRARLDRDEAEQMGRVVISEENLIGDMMPGRLTDGAQRLYPRGGPRLNALAQMLGRRPTSIALAVREPATFLTSVFGMWLMDGKGLHFGDFLGGVDPRTLRWSELAARLIEETGTPRLSVWRFEDYPRDRDKVLARLIGPTRVAVVRGQPKALVGFSQAAYDLLLARGRGVPPGEELGAIARDARNAFPRDEGVPGIRPLPDALLRESRAAYERDWAALTRLPGVRPVV